MLFSEQAWKNNSDIYQKIINAPFNKELLRGSLCLSKFKEYIIQDYYYLIYFRKSLSILSSRTNNIDDTITFLNAAKYVIESEQELHKKFFKIFNIKNEYLSNEVISPICHHYSQFLINTSLIEPYPIAIAAILPCFRIYAEISTEILNKVEKTNPYYIWIENYSGQDFNKQVDLIESLVDRVASLNNNNSIISDMYEKYRIASKLELMFWESAYNIEKWL